MTDSKNKKKLSITEGTGGGHAASIAESGMEVDDKKFYCPKCGGYFYTANERNNHGCPIIEYK